MEKEAEMPKGMGYGGKGVGKAVSERKGGGSAKAGRQSSGQSAIGDGRVVGPRGGSDGLGTGEKPLAAGSSKTQIKNDVQR